MGFLKVLAESSANAENRLRPSQLPLYGKPEEPEYTPAPEKQSLYRDYVSKGRKSAWKYIQAIQSFSERAEGIFETGRAHANDTIYYFQEDSGTLPRTALITVSGLAGIVLGFRGGVMRKAGYCSLGMASAAAICYPSQTIQLYQLTYQRGTKNLARLWKSEQKCGVTPSELSLPGKDRPKEIPKDTGQSSVADKDMYTTRV